MKKYTYNNRLIFYILVIFNTIYGAVTALSSIVAGKLVNIGIYETYTGNNKFYYIALILIFLTLLVGISKSYIKTEYVRRVREKIERDLFNAAIKTELSTTNVINTFCLEVDTVMDNYYSLQGESIIVLVSFVIALGYSLSVSWLTIVIITVSFIVLILLNQVMLSPIGKYMDKLSKTNEKLNNNLLGFLNAINTLKVYSKVGFAYKRINNALIDRNKSEKEKANYEVVVEGVNCLFSTLMQIVPLAVTVIMVVNGQLKIGTALAVMLLFEKIVSPIDVLSTIIQSKKASELYRKKIENIISEGQDNEESVIDIDLKGDDAIRINDLNVTLDEKKILNGVNLFMKDKTKNLVIGRNGAGKSTLFKTITKQISDYNGEIQVYDKNLKYISNKELFKAVGIIPQKPEVFVDTVLNNITLGKEYDPERLNKALESAGLNKDILNEVISENQTNFSGGEIQRIILARMFYNPKKIYLLDEITVGLGYKLADYIENAILNNCDSTIIHISHRTNDETRKKYDNVIDMNVVNKLCIE